MYKNKIIKLPLSLVILFLNLYSLCSSLCLTLTLYFILKCTHSTELLMPSIVYVFILYAALSSGTIKMWTELTVIPVCTDMRWNKKHLSQKRYNLYIISKCIKRCTRINIYDVFLLPSADSHIGIICLFFLSCLRLSCIQLLEVICSCCCVRHMLWSEDTAPLWTY